MIREELIEKILMLCRKHFVDQSAIVKEMPSGYVEIFILKFETELYSDGHINLIGPDIYLRLEPIAFENIQKLEEKFLEIFENNLKNYEKIKDLPIPDTTPHLNRLWNWIKKRLGISN